MSSVFRRVYGRIPRGLRRGAALVAVYQGVQYISASDKLYKFFSPSAHALGSTILDLDLSAVELLSSESSRSPGPIASSDQISLQRLILAIRNAKDDPRVAGLVVRGISGLGKIGLAEISELRSAVQDFSEGWGGKPAVLHVPDGLGVNGTIPLFFSSAFNSTHVQPTSSIFIPGLSAASVFVKGTLEKLGITPTKVARKEYKTAANMYTEKQYTPAHRESTEALLDTINQAIIEGVAAGRAIPTQQVANAIDVGIMTAPEAAAKNLIDKCAYRDELPELIREMLEEGVRNREDVRKAATHEWKAAMEGLVQEWLRDDGAELHRWNNGKLIAKLRSPKVAVPAVCAFADPSRSEGTRRVYDAELRALRAHLAWIETRPWEAIPRAQRADSLMYALGNVASIVELERRLCNESIRALEQFQLELDPIRGSDNLSVADAKKILRWTRAIWRAKTLSSRMVALILDSKTALGTTGASVSVSEAMNDNPPTAWPETMSESFTPRLFLLHQLGDAEDSFEGTASGIDATSYIDRHSHSGEWKERLRYLRLSEYMDLISQEQRAAQRRMYSLFRSDSVKQEGMPEGERLWGLIDSAEQFALYRLASSSLVFTQPWRMYYWRNSPTVAVIHVDGAINDESADDIRSYIRRAEKDCRVHAIVIRIDSPGGSATASDLIARAIEVAKKPTVASMGNVCASGGYFISSPCDKIFAEKVTITGSIGVIFSSFRLTGLYDKLGLNVDSVDRGRFAKYFGAAGAVEEWNSEFKERIDHIVDNFYTSFVSIAARGRGMSYDDLEKIARGRVWSGDDAHRLGLVDHIGGLKDAVDMAAELAGGPPDSGAFGVMYPSIPMMVENRLRRVGAIPSRLDEEGDERVPRSRRQGRVSWRMLFDGDDNEEGDDHPDDGSGDPSGDVKTACPEREETGPATHNGDPSMTDKSISTSMIDCLNSWGPRGKLSNAGQSVISMCLLWLLNGLDDQLFSRSPSWPATRCIDMMALFIPGGSVAASVLQAERSANQATDGKVAAIMTPQIHISQTTGSNSQRHH